jgi:hypothetical protein
VLAPIIWAAGGLTGAIIGGAIGLLAGALIGLFGGLLRVASARDRAGD